MLSSITPLGQRSRGMSWGRTVSAFWAGATLTGAVTFGAAGAIGELSGLEGSFFLGLGALGLALVLDIADAKPPGARRQVDEDWLGRYRDWVVGLGFGSQLGSGFATIIPTWGTWAIAVMSVSAGLPGAALVGVAFGAGRSVLLLRTAGSTTTSRLADSLFRFTSAESKARWAAVAGYGLVIVFGGLYVA